MRTGYKDFCNGVKLKRHNDKDILENKVDPWIDSRERITFRVNMYESAPIWCLQMDNYGKILFNLDEEDLDYLFNKYHPKVLEEMESNIKEIREGYSGVSSSI